MKQRTALAKVRRIEQMLEASGELVHLSIEEKREGIEIGYDNIENDIHIITIHHLIQMVKKYREASK